MTLPQDVKPQWSICLASWLNVIRRLQSTGRKQDGFAIVKLTVIIDQDGCPRMWLEPSIERLEPKADVQVSISDLEQWCDKNSVSFSDLLSRLSRS